MTWWAWVLLGVAAGVVVTVGVQREVALYRRATRRGGMVDLAGAVPTIRYPGDGP